MTLALLVLAGCAAEMQTIKVTNKTDRPIEELYIYKVGSANHGASRGTVAAGATTSISIARGNLEVTAISAKVHVAEHTNERRQASSAVELKRAPVELVFYDEAKPPQGIAPDAIKVPFTTEPEPAKPAEPTEPTEPPAP